MPDSPPIDIVLRRVRDVRVASIVRVGAWKFDNLRTEFGELARWAKRVRVRGRRWIFVDRGHHRWEACLEIRRSPPVDGRIRLRTLRGGTAASVVFDPERVSSRLIYHALQDWARLPHRGRRKGTVEVREVYPTDPWKSARAWAHCEVQFLLRR